MKININTLLSLVMVCILGLGLYMNNLTLKESTSWNKKVYAQTLATDHNEKTKSFREIISKEFPDIGKDEGAEGISKERAAKIINADPATDNETVSINNNIVELLNYLECLVSAYTNEIADQEMMREGFGVMILKYYKYFENYISEHARIHNSHSWQILEDDVPVLEKDLEY